MSDRKTRSSTRNETLSGNGIRTGLSVSELKQSFLDNLFSGLGRIPEIATLNDIYLAVSMTVRDRVLMQGARTMENYAMADFRNVAYLSAEFLPGPHLANNLLNLGIMEETRQAMSELGMNLDEIIEQEEEPGLGNGGLGRLASCYLDSLASLEVHAIGYGIRYEFGIFDQTIQKGQQLEITDDFLCLFWRVELVNRPADGHAQEHGHDQGYEDHSVHMQYAPRGLEPA
jgi:starch phosphorylase